MAQVNSYRFDGPGDVWQHLLDGLRHLGIFRVNRLHDLQRTHAVDLCCGRIDLLGLQRTVQLFLAGTRVLLG